MICLLKDKHGSGDGHRDSPSSTLSSLVGAGRHRTERREREGRGSSATPAQHSSSLANNYHGDNRQVQQGLEARDNNSHYNNSHQR